uniref:Uncharacterized protein n=1 Tax=Ciona savignyi TaxID=51511 RepID=H2ZDW0_CIOSA
MQEPRNPQRTKLIRKHADVSSPFSKGYINRTVKYNERPRSVWINTEEGKKVTAEESTRLPVYNNGVGLLKTWKSPTAVSPHHNINDFSWLAGNSKALEKLKETINFQRLNRSSVELESSKSCNASDIKEVAGDQDVGRKIAVVSYAPSYKGFNEATTKVRKITENNHHQTFHPSTLTKDGQEPYSAKKTDVSMRTFSRKFIKTAGGKVGGDFPITTSAWKKGKIIAENILQNSSHKNA